MNKTVNINLGGMFFHIDEDAYQKLTRYFDAIKRSLSNSTGQDEIIKDIEMRIAELISEKHVSEKQVISLKELDEIIAVMGQPEDYRIEDEPAMGTAQAIPGFDNVKRRKKLYRDTEKGMLGGVATGLGHYFGIDSVWLKILFLVFVFAGFGAGVVAYIVLWIVTPAAITTSEKLEMTGEPVTISNIERKVREEYETLSERFKNTNFERTGNQVRTGAGRIAGNFGDAFMSVFKVLAKILGALIVVFSIVSLAGLIIALFTVGSSSLAELPMHHYANAVNYTDVPLWIIALLGFFAIGIPFFFLFILGLKLLVNNLKSIGNPIKYSLLAVWLISVGILAAFGVKQATAVAFEGKIVSKETLEIKAGDTLDIRFRYNDYFAKDVESREEFQFTQDEAGKELIYSNQVSLNVLKSDNGTAYMQIERLAQGKSMTEARKRAEKIRYGFEIIGGKLVLDNYLLTDLDNKYRGQQVEIYLYLPEGVIIRPDSTIQNYDDSDNGFFNLHHSGDYLYRVDETKVMCLDCPADENDWEDVEGMGDPQDSTVTTTVTVNGETVRVDTKEEGDKLILDVSEGEIKKQ